MRFKIGDRVHAIAPCDGMEETIDECGEVMFIDKGDAKLPVKVWFDSPIGLTDGLDDGGHLLWCEEDSLELENYEAPK